MAGDEDEEGEESADGLIQLPGSREVLEASLYIYFFYIYIFVERHIDKVQTRCTV